MSETASELLSSLSIGIAVLPRPTKKGFSGTGVKRRREESTTRQVAELLAKHICRVHKFSAPGQQVEEKQVAAFLFECLMAIPDEVAKALTATNVDVSLAARNEIAASLENSLLAKWVVKYEPHQWDAAADGRVKWHRPADTEND